MRHWIFMGLALFALGFSTSAEAGKKNKKPKGDDTEQKADGDEAQGIVLETTGVADIDAFFAKAQAPVDTLTNTRLSIDKINTDLATSLGLAEGTPFADAIADLQSKADGKISMAMDGDKPTLSAEDGVPENVQTSVDAMNSGMDELMKVAADLPELPDQFQALIEEGKTFADVSKLTSMGVKPLQAPKVAKVVGNNMKALGGAPDEAKMLIESLDGMKTTLTDTFGGSGENPCGANPCNPCGG